MEHKVSLHSRRVSVLTQWFKSPSTRGFERQPSEKRISVAHYPFAHDSPFIVYKHPDNDSCIYTSLIQELRIGFLAVSGPLC